MIYRILALLTLIILVSCSHSVQKDEENIEDQRVLYTNKYDYESRFQKTRTNSEWQGTYKGFLPCADCYGIESYLTVNTNNTYKLKYKYAGKDTAYTEVSGSFTWNDADNIITLNGIEEGPNQYLLGEDQFSQLDTNGNRIIGNLQEEYIFEKQPAGSENTYLERLVDRTWQLVEVNGEKVPKLGKDEIPATVRFTSDFEVFGNGGCNVFNGTFVNVVGNKIYFGKMARTLKTCTRMRVEDLFVLAFNNTDRYEFDDNDFLILKSADGKTLAKLKLD